MELLVVIAIIALLLAILMPSLQKAKELAKQVVCSSRQRQLTLALMAYTQEYSGWIMPFITSYEKVTFQPWQSPSDRDPSIKIADHTWYGLLWAAKGIDNRDVFFCPSVAPSNNAQHKIKNENKNVEETRIAWTLGMRVWCIQDKMLSQWRNWMAPKPISAVKRPSEFFLLADSVNPGGLVATDYKGARFGQLYFIQEWERAENWTSWKGAVHLRHGDKAGGLFADGHAEFKPMQFWVSMHDRNGWNAQFNLNSDKPGYRVFDAEVKNRWEFLDGQYVKQPIPRNWAPLN